MVSQKIEEEKSLRLRAQFLFYGSALALLAVIILGYIFYRNYRLKQKSKIEQLENETQTKIINATIDAKEKERKTIAGILHDSVSALLSSANLHLQATRKQFDNGVPIEIDKSQQIITEASKKIRDLSHTLVSSVLLKFGLNFAIKDIAEKYSNSELIIETEIGSLRRYHQTFEMKVHNIIQELINILKHSSAKRAVIKLEEKEGQILLEICDNGIGFDILKIGAKDGLGINQIKARIHMMKGTFNVISNEGKGTIIKVEIPILEKEELTSLS